MAMADPKTLTIVDLKITHEIDWQRTFPFTNLAAQRDPVKRARKICADVDKLRSCSDAGKAAVKRERCARDGLSVHGEPVFYLGKTYPVR